MRLPSLRVPLIVQVGAVALLFAAALGALWMSGAEVVKREARRETAKLVLDQAGEELARQGAADLATAPEFPFTISNDEWDALDRQLAAITAQVLAPYEGVEGGYFIRSSSHPYLGHAFPTEPDVPRLDGGAEHKSPRRSSEPPPREFYVIQSQIETSLAKNQASYVVVDVPPSTIALRTAPVWVDGRLLGATWIMTRLTDPLFLERSLKGYQLAAGLALSGIALALLLTFGLARTVRRQAVERERLQAELRRSERLAALGKLLAGVAHEVRNPLAGLRSTVQLHERGLIPDNETMTDIEAEVDRLEAIVSRLLQFSRADAQELAPGDLNAVLSEAARLARPTAEGQGVRIELELDPELPPVAMAPPALLQVFRNLTANALQAMPEGGTLHIETRFDKMASRIEARVSDTGGGLPPEIESHLFEPFFTTKPDGTGLGLAIAREIALAHRGEIRAESLRNGHAGALFVLTLPVAKPS